MGKDFEVTDELELQATPEQVWAAIATGPGMDAWFLGRNQVEAGHGGLMRSDFAGGAIPALEITEWDPGHKLSNRSPTAPDGRFIAYDQLVEARSDGSTRLRIVSSGFLPGDDWEDEFQAMRAGSCIFRSSLAAYLTYFSGRTAVPVTVFGPPVADWDAAWKAVDDSFGLTSPVDRGRPARLSTSRLSVEGEVYAANDQARGIRAADGLYRFLQGFGGTMVVVHALFDPTVDAAATAADWQAWLNELNQRDERQELDRGESR